MTIISQAAVVILIAGIAMILTRSNRDLKKAYEEGEHFVDEWALREEKLRKYRESGKKLSGKAPGRLPLKTLPEEETVPEIISQEDTGPDPVPQEEIPDPEQVRQKLPAALSLVIYDENSGRTSSTAVTELPFTIGRGKENDLVLSDLSVARKHCRIEPDESGPVLLDSGSANGILFEGEEVRSLPLRAGSTFYLGFLRITVAGPDSEEAGRETVTAAESR